MCIIIHTVVFGYKTPMTLYSIRNHYLVLLIWAATAMVMNPVWDAVLHYCEDCHHEEVDVVSFVEDDEEHPCPYCDAVSHFADTASTESVFVLTDLHEQSASISILYPDLRLRISSRLRAPPTLA